MNPIATPRFTRSQARRQNGASPVSFVRLKYDSPRSQAQYELVVDKPKTGNIFSLRSPSVTDNGDGSGSQGPFGSGSDTSGSDRSGSHTSGTDALGSDGPGSDALGSDAPGSDTSGSNAPGSNASISDDTGTSDSRDDAPPPTVTIQCGTGPLGFPQRSWYDNFLDWTGREWSSILSILAVLLSVLLLAQVIAPTVTNTSVEGNQALRRNLQAALDPKLYADLSNAATLAHDLTWNNGQELPQELMDIITESALAVENWSGRLERSDHPPLKDLDFSSMLATIWSIQDLSRELNSRIRAKLYPAAVYNGAIRLHSELTTFRNDVAQFKKFMADPSSLKVMQYNVRTLFGGGEGHVFLDAWLRSWIDFLQQRQELSRKVVRQSDRIATMNTQLADRQTEEFSPQLSAAHTEFLKTCQALEKSTWSWERPVCGPGIQLTGTEVLTESDRRIGTALALQNSLLAIRQAHLQFAESLAKSAAALREIAAKPRRITLESLSSLIDVVLEQMDAALAELRPFKEYYDGIHN